STNARTGNTTRGGSRRPSHISRRSTVGTKRRCSPGRSPRSRNPWTAMIFRRTRLLRKDTAGRRRNSRSKISFEVRHGGHRRPLPVLRVGRVQSRARRARQSVLSELRTSGGLQVRRRRIATAGPLEGVGARPRGQSTRARGCVTTRGRDHRIVVAPRRTGPDHVARRERRTAPPGCPSENSETSRSSPPRRLLVDATAHGSSDRPPIVAGSTRGGRHVVGHVYGPFRLDAGAPSCRPHGPTVRGHVLRK